MCLNVLRRTHVRLVTPLFILGLSRLSIYLIAIDLFHGIVTLINVIIKHEHVFTKSKISFVFSQDTFHVYVLFLMIRLEVSLSLFMTAIHYRV